MDFFVEWINVMKNLLKNKKFIFFVILVLIFVAVAGIFLFWPKEVNNTNSNQNQNEEGPEDFSITGNLIENKDYDLSFLYPDGWNIRNHGVYGIDLFSSEIEFDENGGFLQSARETGGCIVGVEIRRTSENSELLDIFINKIKDGSALVEDNGIKYQLVSVNSKDALETIFLKDSKEIFVTVEIPVDDIIYEFNNGMIFSDRCIEEFNKILDTVIINR